MGDAFVTPVRPLRLSSLSRALLAAGSLICAVVTAAAQTPDAGLVARGEYLMHAADCMPCHTVRGAASFSGGLAFKARDADRGDRLDGAGAARARQQ